MEIELTTEGIYNYGADVSHKLSDFSSRMLQEVNSQNSQEAQDSLDELLKELALVDVSELQQKQGFLARFFHKDQFGDFVKKYEAAQEIISRVKRQLIQAEYQLRKDIRLCDVFLENNKEYISDLDTYIAAGKAKVEEERKNISEKKANAKDQLAIQEAAQEENMVKALERKVYNLETLRMVAIQNIPQILLLKEGNMTLVEKIKESIDTVIPLWENQMLIAIALIRQREGVRLQKAVSDTTNRMLLANAQMLKDSSIAIATENNRGVVDIETLRKSNNDLIETITMLKKIKKTGEEQRKQAAAEIVKLQTQLNDALR